ncbi:MAG: hypothetical protein ACOX0R_02335 [Candidatus Dojkabacteria bacterium]|jgi:uncharacterized protein YpmS
MNTNYILIILLSLPILLLVLFLISKILPKGQEDDETREEDEE